MWVHRGVQLFRGNLHPALIQFILVDWDYLGGSHFRRSVTPVTKPLPSFVRVLDKNLSKVGWFSSSDSLVTLTLGVPLPQAQVDLDVIGTTLDPQGSSLESRGRRRVSTRGEEPPTTTTTTEEKSPLSLSIVVWFGIRTL